MAISSLNKIQVLLAACFLFAMPVLATVEPVLASPEKSAMAGPDELIRDATGKILIAIKDAKSYYSENPQRFNAEIDKIMTPIIDFRSFARGVMGKYGSKKFEAALSTEQEKAQFEARVQAFSGKFKEGLMATYAKGLLTFKGERIDVDKPAEAALAGKSVVIVQNIYTEAPKPVTIKYKMRASRLGEWKVRNVLIQKVNLGKVYSKQFSSAAKQYKGDIDRVIQNWVVASRDVGE